jgi:hypothetical protein
MTPRIDKALLSELKDLHLPAGEYVLVGGAALAVRGLRETRSLDVLLTDRLWGELQKQYKLGGDGGWLVLSQRVDGYREASFPTAPGLPSARKRIEAADVIGGIPYLSREHLLTMKITQGRSKDLADAKLIRGVLAARPRC